MQQYTCSRTMSERAHLRLCEDRLGTFMRLENKTSRVSAAVAAGAFILAAAVYFTGLDRMFAV